jgi:sirohydrochlorin ferrochelatase
MNKRYLAIASALILLCASPQRAAADGGMSAAVVAAVMQVAKQLEDPGDGSDWKVILLSGSHCGYSKHDGENRSTRLARYYRELTSAYESGNVDLLVQRATRLRDQVNASKMYKSCFHAMGKSSKIMKTVNEIVAAAS